MKKKISLKFISTFFIAAFSITALISSCAFADEFLTVTKKFVQKDEKVPLAVPNASCLKTKIVQGEIIELEATSKDEGVTFNWSVEGKDSLKGTPGFIDNTGDSKDGSKVVYTAPNAAVGTVIISCYASKSGYVNSEKKSIELTIIKLTELPTPTIITSDGKNEVISSNIIVLKVSNPILYSVYHWSVTGEGSLNQTEGLQVSFTAGSGYGDVVVSCYASMEGYENSKVGEITLAVRLGRLATPEITGDNYVQLKDGSATALFSVKTPENEVVYEWKIESGAGVINSSGLFSSVTSGDVTISCRATRIGYVFSEKSTRSFAVISQKLNKPQIVVKDNSTDLIVGEKYTLQVVNPIEGFVYKWTVNVGSLESSAGTSVVYTAPSGSSDATISCVASISGFTDSEAGTLSARVKLGKLITPQITPTKTVLKISETVEITAASTDAGVSYCWILPSGASAIGEKLQYSESTVGYKTVKCYATKTGYFDSEIIEVVLRVVSEEDNPELFLAAPELEVGGNSLELSASTDYTINVKSPNSLYTYNWEATSGSLSALTGSTVTYRAPDIVSTPVVKCYVSRSGFYDSTKTSLAFSVKLGKLAKPVISSAKTSIKIGEVLSLSATNGVEGSIFNWSVTSGGITSSGSSVNYSDTTIGTKTIRCYGVKEGYYDSDTTEYVVNVVQSSDVTALSLNGAISHRVTQTGYDFGYAASETTKTITLTNISSGVVTLKSVSLVSSPQFQLVGTMPTSVSAGGSCEIQVRFIPTANEWLEGTLKLVDDTDLERDFKLLGSGYKQPSNISDLALWLRADRIANEDLIGEVYVEKMPDLSGRNMHAYRDTISSSPPNPYDRPVYQSNGINGLPTIVFSGTQYMKVLTTTERIADNVPGTTTFVVFKTGTVNTTRYVLSVESASLNGFPELCHDGWYFDPDNGLYGLGGANRKLQYKLSLWGRDISGSLRSPIDSIDNTIVTNTNFAVGMAFDSSIPDPNPNIKMWINGENKDLGYLYSYTGNVADTNTRAYGLPIGDGVGNRRAGLGASNTEDPYKYDRAWAYSNGNAIFKNRASDLNKTIKDLYIGIKYTKSSAFSGEIAEVFIFARALNDTEIGDINNYIKKRYNIGL